MANFLDQNDRDVAGLLHAYDELVALAEAYLASLDEQHRAALEADQAQLARHLDTGRRAGTGLMSLLENEVLEQVTNLRNNQHHIRMARLGKLV